MKAEKFKVTGMSCSACSSRVEKVVSKMVGTEDVSVNLLTGSMTVKFDDGKESAQDIISEVEKAGYGASIEGDEGGDDIQVSKGAIDETVHMKKRLIWSVILLIPLMLASLIPAGTGNVDRPVTMALIQIMILIPIVFLNRKFFIKGVPGFFRGSPNMDSLVSFGAGTSIIYGVFTLFKMVHGLESGNPDMVMKYANGIYYQSAGTILTFITIGKYLETKSKGKTSEAIEKLIKLAPETATVIRNGKETKIKSKDLVPGDVLVIRPGENLAADGIIVKGRAAVDQSVITGESIPVEVGEGDRVVSGSVNRTGFIHVKCDKTGKDTTISKIIELVEEASASKAPIAQLADKIAGVFVPVVMSIALATVIIWFLIKGDFGFALSMGITVLVISCPCALGLATPVAIMVGTGKGAQQGILIKSGEAFQTASEVDTVVLDKTGTVTEGHPVVTDIILYDNDKVSEHFDGTSVGSLSENMKLFVSDAVSLEKGSEHPLSEAVIEFGKKMNIQGNDPDEFTAIPGRGVKAVTEGRKTAAGNRKLMEESKINIGFIESQYGKLAEEGKTPLIFAEEGKAKAIIAVADIPKPTSGAAIRHFRELGIDVVMLTGDNKVTGEAIGKSLGITKVIADVFPEDKEKHIAGLQKKGHKVAMIGDGINDAPALVRADVGIAIGAGTDVAIESADTVLMNSDLEDGVTAIELSRAVIKNIKQSLTWAFCYNLILIPLAAGVLFPLTKVKLNPMIGALAMSMSSVIVVSNALRLRHFKGRREERIEKKESEYIKEGGSCSLMKTIQDEGSREKEKEIMKYEIGIEGMMCPKCQAHAHEALKGLDGVVKAEVNLEGKKAIVDSEREIDEKEFVDVISAAGYEVTYCKALSDEKFIYEVNIEGMMCPKCQAHAKDALEEIDGVKYADVNLEEEKAEVEAGRKIEVEEIESAIEKAGYKVTNIKSL